MDHPRLILGSTSPFRRELLQRLRLPFEAVAPHFVEPEPPLEPVSVESAKALALDNARGKAQSLAEDFPGALILASDQVGECEGRILSKPSTVERAIEQLRFLAGREHRLYTAVVLLATGSARGSPAESTLLSEVVTNELRIRDLPPSWLRSYVEAERPLSAVGSYYSESLGIALFEYLRGDDPTAIIGLPLITVCRMLEAHSLSPLAPRAAPQRSAGGRESP